MQTATVVLCLEARMGLRGSGGLSGRNGKPSSWTFHSVCRGGVLCELRYLAP